jgi:hypothetical protein
MKIINLNIKETKFIMDSDEVHAFVTKYNIPLNEFIDITQKIRYKNKSPYTLKLLSKLTLAELHLIAAYENISFPSLSKKEEFIHALHTHFHHLETASSNSSSLPKLPSINKLDTKSTLGPPVYFNESRDSLPLPSSKAINQIIMKKNGSYSIESTATFITSQFHKYYKQYRNIYISKGKTYIFIQGQWHPALIEDIVTEYIKDLICACDECDLDTSSYQIINTIFNDEDLISKCKVRLEKYILKLLKLYSIQ